jgi:hypothetical protein
VGGADAVDVMANIPWELKCPKVNSDASNCTVIEFHIVIVTCFKLRLSLIFPYL